MTTSTSGRTRALSVRGASDAELLALTMHENRIAERLVGVKGVRVTLT